MIKSDVIGKIKRYFSRKPFVGAVYLYGSQVRGTAKKESDIDLGVILLNKEVSDRPFVIPQVVFAQELSHLLGKEVEVCDLEICRIDFSHRVISEGKLIYSGNEAARVSFEEKVLRDYFLLKPALDEYYHYLSLMARKGELGVRYL